MRVKNSLSLDDIYNQNYLKEWFDYDGENGVLIRKKRPIYGAAKIGGVAGNRRKSDGRMYLHHFGKRVICSRLIFLWHHGFLPDEIDHIDRDCTNDRIENLRPSSRRQNVLNEKNRSKKWRGANKNKNANTFSVRVWDGSKNINVGSTRNEEDAATAWNFAMYNLHKDDHDFVMWNNHPYNIGIEETWPKG